MTNKVEIDWQEYLEIVARCFKKLKSFGSFDVIYAPMRGGLIPAVMASHQLDTKMYPIDIVAEDQKISVVSNDPMNGGDNLLRKRVLLIDDIADTGETLKKCVDYLNSKGYINIIICTLVTKQKSKIIPDVTEKKIVDNDWVVFPYEKE